MTSSNRMKMRATSAMTALLLAFSVTASLAEDDIPKRPPFDHYASLLNKSPFAVATALVEQQAPPFAKDLYLANAARIPGGDMVTIQSAVDRNFKEYLTTKAPNEHGYSIVSIDWSERPAETKVTISKDGQTAPLGFNQALMSQAPQPSGPNPPGPLGQPSMSAPAYVPPRAPLPGTVATPIPHVRGPIQRNPAQRPLSQ